MSNTCIEILLPKNEREQPELRTNPEIALCRVYFFANSNIFKQKLPS